jgi:hypothetical protein
MGDFDMDMGDTGEGVEIKVASSIQQSLFKTQAIIEEESDPEMGIEEENMDDWEDDSKAPSIYKKSSSIHSSKPAPVPKYFSLFDEKPKPKRRLCDVKERFYKHQEKIKEKVEKLSKEVQEREVEECTFKPTTLNKNQTKGVQEFLKQVQKYEDCKKDKLNQKIAEKEAMIKTMKKTSKPNLCSKSLKIAAKVERNGIEKLAKAKTQQKPPPDPHPYKPTVNQRSKDLFRGQRVEQLLYEDALRRSSRSLTSTPVMQEKFISARSEQVLLDKFKKDFEDHFAYLDTNESSAINYTKFTTLLANMNFISRSSVKIHKQKLLAIELWNLVGGDESGSVNFFNLQSVLTCVMNFKDPTIPAHSSQIGLGQMIDEVFCVRPEEIIKIHQKFSLLFEERTQSRKASIPEESVIETRKKSDTQHEDRLIFEKTRLQEKWDQIRQQKIFDEINECTFQPQIKRGPRTIASSSDLNESNISSYSFFSEAKSTGQRRNDVLFEYSKLFNQQRLNTSKLILDHESQNEVKSCTFKPTIKKTPKFEEVPEAKGVKDMISRLRNSRKNEKIVQEKPFLFGLEKKKQRIKIDLNSSCSSVESLKSEVNKSFTSDVDEVSVRVDLPGGKKSWLRFNSGDDKSKVVSTFLRTQSFNSSPQVKKQLKKIFS